MTFDERIIAHLDFARAVAGRTIGPVERGGDREDLLGWGTLGLVQAAHRYREGGGASFAAFAARRVRGCVQDALRAADPLSRSERRAYRTAVQIGEDLPAPYVEISLDAIIERGSEPRLPVPAKAGRRDPRWGQVARELRELPAVERRVLVLAYARGLTLREIGAQVGLSESGVCRMRARALARVRRSCGRK